MTDQANRQAEFVENRLRGDSLPPDLSILVSNRDELARLTGVVLNSSASWAPWLDTSYLTEKDLADPDIRANVRAIGEVCKFIDFVAEDEDGNYLGYWRGPNRLPLSEAPVVCLDNEGQFDFCGTANIAGAILTRCGRFEHTRPWLLSIGIESLPKGPHDLFDLDTRPSPRELHADLYEKFEAEERAT